MKKIKITITELNIEPNSLGPTNKYLMNDSGGVYGYRNEEMLGKAIVEIVRQENPSRVVIDYKKSKKVS